MIYINVSYERISVKSFSRRSSAYLFGIYNIRISKSIKGWRVKDKELIIEEDCSISCDTDIKISGKGNFEISFSSNADDIFAVFNKDKSKEKILELNGEVQYLISQSANSNIKPIKVKDRRVKTSKSDKIQFLLGGKNYKKTDGEIFSGKDFVIYNGEIYDEDHWSKILEVKEIIE